MQASGKILGFGKAVPETVVTNHDLEEILDTSDEWISKRTGIKERHVINEELGEGATMLATKAARSCFEQIKRLHPQLEFDPTEHIDLIICSTATSDALFPSTACMVQGELGIKDAGAFDIMAACSGFVYALNIADNFIKSGQYRNILIVSVDIMSRYVDWGDRRTAILFGDGAGAAVLSASHDEKGLSGFYLRSEADIKGSLKLKNTYSKYPVKACDIDIKPEMVEMDGQAVYQFAVKALPDALEQACKRAEMETSEIDWVVPHQANYRIIESAAKRVGISPDRFIMNIHKYGNTSSASIPIAFYDAIEEGKIVYDEHKTQNIALAGFGAGLTWGGCILKF
jgi:3-oxoacyl-[acyl-carrier-protein] synthase-3